MNTLTFFSAIIMALAGSLHCAGMCGPLVLALPIQSNRFSLIFGRILYNIGRVFTYTILGFLIGLAGSKFILFGYQQTISIILGLMLILFAVLPEKYKKKFLSISFINKYISRITKNLGNRIRGGKLYNMFIIGVLNGLLPCGFVYVALTAAAAMGSSFNSAIVMMGFGIGTIPIMFLTSFASKIFKFNILFRRVVPVLTVILALVIILRGMNLGIPYLSPVLTKPTTCSHCK